MIREAIFKLVDKQDLTYDEAYDVINEIMSGETTQVQTAAFLSPFPRSRPRAKLSRKLQVALPPCAVTLPRLIAISRCSRLWAQAGIKPEASTSLPPQRFIIAAGGAKVASMETGQHRASRVRQIAKRLWA